MGNFTRGALPLAIVLVLGAPLSAEASVTQDVANFFGLSDSGPAAQDAQPRAGFAQHLAKFLGLSRTDQSAEQSKERQAVDDIPAPIVDQPVTVTAPDTIERTVDLHDFAVPSLPSAAVPALPQPSVETPLHKLFCVEYARALSGLNIFGDAKYWWEHARNLYARVTTPVENAVMVFAPSKRLKKGHVAVVSAIVSKREIRVEQANWQNHGEIDHATPVMDVSPRNDWSQVRVWDTRSGTFGRVYAVSGFIAKDLVRQASRD